ncbi:MAG: homoserine dehydrogenase [Thermoplasmatota archaeon]
MKIAFAGFGVVGRGLSDLLLEKREDLSSQYGLEWEVVAVSDMLKGSVMDPSGLDLAALLKLADEGKSLELIDAPIKGFNVLEMIERSGADVLVEVTYTDIRTGEPATAHIKKALEKGMHVVTTNKGPIALNYRNLSSISKDNDVMLLFEGTVMSGTPVLNLIRENLAGNHISEIKGIFNGTTNYILSKMEDGLSYEEALRKAQELGYAEAVPDADVLGWDALAKVTILSNVVFGAEVKPFDNPCEGITKITSEDITRAKSNGKRYKLIGKVWREGEKVKGSVAPEEIELTHPLAGVMGAVNAATITTDALGDITIVGAGAGRRETGYSLFIDIIDIHRKMG